MFALCKLASRNTESSSKSLKIFHKDVPEIKHSFFCLKVTNFIKFVVKILKCLSG